jgi:hypothetical protein
MLWWLFFVLLLGLQQLACSGDWRTYRNQEHGYRIDFPGDWQVIGATADSNDANSFTETLQAHEIHKVTFAGGGPGFEGTFEVRIVANPEDLTVEEWARRTYVDVFDSSLASLFEPTTLGGESATRFMIFEFDQTGRGIARGMDGRILVLHFADANPNDADFETHRTVYARMVESFRFLRPREE